MRRRRRARRTECARRSHFSRCPAAAAGLTWNGVPASEVGPHDPMPRNLLAIALLSAVLAGCGKHATEPPPPPATGPAPALLATQPAPRATSALYDDEIWAQFDRPLDGRTVTPQTVFLKLDGQRVSITPSYDGITRRVFVRPASVLELQRTYTVEFSTGVHGADGTPLPAGVFFQFTTNSLRRLAYDYPADDALEGPLACLGWGGTKGPDGNIFYEVYASRDSDAVARRALPSLQRSVFTRLLPGTGWPLGERVFWAVTSENLTTHERMNGEVHAFRTLDASTPLDSVVIRPQDHGSNDIRNANTQFCNSVSLPSGPGFNAGLHWNYTPLGANARLAGATLKVWVTDVNSGTFNNTRPSLWMAQNEWLACTMRAPGPPFAEPSGLIANSIAVDNLEVDFDSERLAAMLEAQYRRRTLVYGTLIRTLVNVTFHSPVSPEPAKTPRLVVRFYRLPPAAEL